MLAASDYFYFLLKYHGARMREIPVQGITMFSRNTIKTISPAIKTFFTHIVPKPLQFLFGSAFGLEAAYNIGSAVEGDREESGRKKLSWSSVGYRNGDLFEQGELPSVAVIFSQLHAGEKKTTEIFSPDTVIPVHAENMPRGLFKLQQEGNRILAFSFIATMVAGLATRNLPVLKMLSAQGTLVFGTSIAYGAHRGNMPVMTSHNLFSSKEQRELTRGIHLERSGNREAALEVYTSLVARNPDCQICKFHRKRLAEELSFGEEPVSSERNPHSP